MVDVIASQLTSFFTRASESDLRDVFRFLLPSQFRGNWRAKRWNDMLSSLYNSWRKEVHLPPSYIFSSRFDGLHLKCTSHRWNVDHISDAIVRHRTRSSINKNCAVNAVNSAWDIPLHIDCFERITIHVISRYQESFVSISKFNLSR